MTKTHEPESTKTEHLPMERWEEEGGKTFEIKLPVTTGRFVKPIPTTAGIHDIPRQWSRKFVIEPLQTDAGVTLAGRAGKIQ